MFNSLQIGSQPKRLLNAGQGQGDGINSDDLAEIELSIDQLGFFAALC